jgi:hypothetical protein
VLTQKSTDWVLHLIHKLLLESPWSLPDQFQNTKRNVTEDSFLYVRQPWQLQFDGPQWCPITKHTEKDPGPACKIGVPRRSQFRNERLPITGNRVRILDKELCVLP